MQPRATLAVIGLAIVLIWTILLPRIGDHPPLRESIDRRDALGVNADAMFYTELEAMETLVIEWRQPSG